MVSEGYVTLVWGFVTSSWSVPMMSSWSVPVRSAYLWYHRSCSVSVTNWKVVSKEQVWGNVGVSWCQGIRGECDVRDLLSVGGSLIRKQLQSCLSRASKSRLIKSLRVKVTWLSGLALDWLQSDCEACGDALTTKTILTNPAWVCGVFIDRYYTHFSFKQN